MRGLGKDGVCVCVCVTDVEQRGDVGQHLGVSAHPDISSGSRTAGRHGNGAAQHPHQQTPRLVVRQQVRTATDQQPPQQPAAPRPRPHAAAGRPGEHVLQQRARHAAGLSVT